ncbi:aspartate ammonia-lyase [Helicobacter sp. 11S02629-2]|uniref:aspartate ammonia-lyase n=1 Tax=Helicobacter sp. 11S02629-2 TaxID=1476195 RepID=UPI000BA6A0F9|nr:aspartate ammonia-lyase [Helicobacter sp. 11S02629-2]PAF45941.1 aspartate ammonia-lyase [Helicobacter sp. 11S02629-2]
MSTRIEHDFIGELEIDNSCYYGVQTFRALNNFHISGRNIGFYDFLVRSFVQVKKAAALANFELGLLDSKIKDAIVKACDEILAGKFHDQFVVDIIQGGAGTSTNMNVNEVIANVALEIMGHKKGEYKYCHPNDHVNLSQSTNDTYPTALRMAIYERSLVLRDTMQVLKEAFYKKSLEFKHVIKMGRTQLQDAVPMTLGQEFHAFSSSVENCIHRVAEADKLLLEINLGGTAIGTGINSHPKYKHTVEKYLREITGRDYKIAHDLIQATQDTGAYVQISGVLKRVAGEISKICNDLRLLSSGPRTGINEINLPKMQPGSSIMPGKVNPVIPEVVNQVCFAVIGNDVTVTLAALEGQLQLNVFEPVIASRILESIMMMNNAFKTLVDKCIVGITANEERCKELVLHSIGIVTALNPVLGYEVSASIAKEALKTGKSVYDLVLEHGYLKKEELDSLLKPENMLNPRMEKMGKK